MLAYWVCLLIGMVLWKLAPARWEWGFIQGLVLGSGLYFGALHRYVMRVESSRAGIRWGGNTGILPGAMLRAALFLSLVAVQAYLCYEAWPRIDIRAGFILSSAWLVALAVIDPPQREIVRAPSLSTR